MRYEFSDYVVPKSNEGDFCAMAERLSYSKLKFVYDSEYYIANAKNVSTKLSELSEKYEISLGFAVICKSEKEISELRKREKNVEIVYTSSKESDIRNIIQKFKPYIITNLEFQSHDFMHHRAGINQVISKEMHDKNVTYGVSLQLLFSTKYKGEVIGRIKQNLSLAKKYKIGVKAFTLADNPYKMKGPIDVVSLLVCFGMDSKKAKESIM